MLPRSTRTRPCSEMQPATRTAHPSSSRAQHAVDGDARDRANRDRNRVEVARLIARIECREEDEAEKTAGHRTREHFRGYEHGAPGAAVPVCKVALAAGTSRHSDVVSAVRPH